MKPYMTIFGLATGSDKQKTYNMPHYLQVPNIYPNSRVVQLKSKSVMYSRNAWLEVDFWTADADVFYVEDSLSFVEAQHTSGNHFAYFNPFIKLYRVAHSDCSLSSLGNNKNDQHVLDILNNFVQCDLIWISPILEERFKPVFKEVFSKKLIQTIKEKLVVLPYPAFYKLDPTIKDVPLRISSKKPLVFLWNHRLVTNKNFKDFCWILQEFKKISSIPFKILFACNEDQETILRALPKELHKHMDYRGYIADKDEYTRAILETNITIATAKLESFGNSVFDSINNGVLLINQDCNDALVTLLGGSDYTFSKKDIPEVLVKVYTDKKYRKNIHDFNLKGVRSIATSKQARSTLEHRISELVHQKMDCAPKVERSKVLQVALKELEKNTLSKKDLYKAVGWSQAKNPINAHWAGYYYALRREGIRITVKDERLYFHRSKQPEIKTLTWGS